MVLRVTKRQSYGIHTLDQCWEEWSNATTPPLANSLFEHAVDKHSETLANLFAAPPDGPIVIASDSKEEALAYLYQAFSKADTELERHLERALVFSEAGELPKLAKGTKQFIAIAKTREVEIELAPIAQSMHTVVLYRGS